MASKLIYFGSVISRAEALVAVNLMKEPVWLKACLKFPPLSPPINPELPTWESIDETRTHRVGPFIRLDGHRFDPKKPTEYPKDRQSNHPEQPYHIYFSKDEKRRKFFSIHPDEAVQITYKSRAKSRCERWIEEPDKFDELDEMSGASPDGGRDMVGEFLDIQMTTDVTDIIAKAARHSKAKATASQT